MKEFLILLHYFVFGCGVLLLVVILCVRDDVEVALGIAQDRLVRTTTFAGCRVELIVLNK